MVVISVIVVDLYLLEMIEVQGDIGTNVIAVSWPDP